MRRKKLSFCKATPGHPPPTLTPLRISARRLLPPLTTLLQTTPLTDQLTGRKNPSITQVLHQRHIASRRSPLLPRLLKQRRQFRHRNIQMSRRRRLPFSFRYLMEPPPRRRSQSKSQELRPQRDWNPHPPPRKRKGSGAVFLVPTRPIIT